MFFVVVAHTGSRRLQDYKSVCPLQSRSISRLYVRFPFVGQRAKVKRAYSDEEKKSQAFCYSITHNQALETTGCLLLTDRERRPYGFAWERSNKGSCLLYFWARRCPLLYIRCSRRCRHALLLFLSAKPGAAARRRGAVAALHGRRSCFTVIYVKLKTPILPAADSEIFEFR